MLSNEGVNGVRDFGSEILKSGKLEKTGFACDRMLVGQNKLMRTAVVFLVLLGLGAFLVFTDEPFPKIKKGMPVVIEFQDHIMKSGIDCGGFILQPAPPVFGWVVAKNKKEILIYEGTGFSGGGAFSIHSLESGIKNIRKHDPRESVVGMCPEVLEKSRGRILGAGRSIVVVGGAGQDLLTTLTLEKMKEIEESLVQAVRDMPKSLRDALMEEEQRRSGRPSTVPMEPRVRI